MLNAKQTAKKRPRDKSDGDESKDNDRVKRIKTNDAFDDLIKLPEHEKESTRDFYKELFLTFSNNNKYNEKIKFIVVTHTVPTVPFLLEGLGKIGEVSAIIPKSSDPDENIKMFFQKKYEEKIQSLKDEQKKSVAENLKCKIESVTYKDYLKIPGHAQALINSISSDNNANKIIIIDIGGYFAPALAELAQTGKILGIVEDTENGHQKYRAELQAMEKQSADSGNINFPIISAARSKIKDAEDYNVGKAITDATDHILRVAEYTHIGEAKTILVIGYGKVGSAAAKVAAEKTRGPVLVCEIDPIRKLVASAHSFKVVNLKDGIKEADIIISCTGGKILKNEINQLKDNVYIASCTSSDDEFDLADILNGSKEHLEPDKEIRQFFIGGKRVNFIRGGNAANFAEKAVHGYFIHGVLGSLMVAALQIINSEDRKFNEIEVLSYYKQARIASILMKYKLYPHPMVAHGVEDAGKYFFGRKNELIDLKNKLDSSGRVIIAAPDGYGKSYLANKYRELNSNRYKLIFYIDASVNLRAQFEIIKQKINLHIEEENARQKQLADLIRRRATTDVCELELDNPKPLMDSTYQLKKFFEDTFEPYLLIIDNLNGSRLEELKLYLPTNTKHKRENIIFINEVAEIRKEELHALSIGYQDILELKQYDMDTVQELFKGLIAKDSSELAELANQLAFHPYALHITKTYIKVTGKSIAEFLKIYNEKVVDYKDDPVGAALAVVFDLLSDYEKAVLNLCMLCDINNIPKKFIKVYCNDNGYEYQNIMASLKKLSLLHEKQQGDDKIIIMRTSLKEFLKEQEIGLISVDQLLNILQSSFLFADNEKHAKKYVKSVLKMLDYLAEQDLTSLESNQLKIIISQLERVVDYYMSDKNVEDIISDMPEAQRIAQNIINAINQELTTNVSKKLESFNTLVNAINQISNDINAPINVVAMSNDLANGLKKVGDIFKKLNKFKQSLRFYKEALATYIELPIITGKKIETLFSMSSVEYALKEFSAALDHSLEALELCAENPNSVSEQIKNHTASILCSGMMMLQILNKMDFGECQNLFKRIEEQNLMTAEHAKFFVNRLKELIFLHKDNCAFFYSILNKYELMTTEYIQSLKEVIGNHRHKYDYWALDGGIEAIGYVGKYFDHEFADYFRDRYNMWPNNAAKVNAALEKINSDLNVLSPNDALCQNAQEAYRQIMEALNPAGNALTHKSQNIVWFTYHRSAIKEILSLRLTIVGSMNMIPTYLVCSSYLWNNHKDNDLLVDKLYKVLSSDDVRDHIIQPINLYGKHWLALILTKNNLTQNILINGLDSENQGLPFGLQTTLKKEFSADYKLIPVMYQRYNNCGLEMIENIVWFLGGMRVSQEQALPLHSYLWEQKIMCKEIIVNDDIVKLLPNYPTFHDNKGDLAWMKRVSVEKDEKELVI